MLVTPPNSSGTLCLGSLPSFSPSRVSWDCRLEDLRLCSKRLTKVGDLACRSHWSLSTSDWDCYHPGRIPHSPMVNQTALV